MSDTQVLIYSGEYGLYWRPNRCGYTNRIDEAGRYTVEEALPYTGPAYTGKMIQLRNLDGSKWEQR